MNHAPDQRWINRERAGKLSGGHHICGRWNGMLFLLLLDANQILGLIQLAGAVRRKVLSAVHTAARRQ